MSTKNAKKSTKAAETVEVPAEMPVEAVEVEAKKPRKTSAKAKTEAKAEVSETPAVEVEVKTEAKAEPKTRKSAKAKSPAAAAAEPVEAETEEVDDESAKKKLTVAKGSVTVKTTRKSSKSPAKKSPARKTPAKKAPARKSPARKQSKSPAKKSPKKTNAKAVAKTAGKRSAKGAKKGTKVTKPRRPYNTKPAPIDFSGIGIGPAKVKKVLMHMAFNHNEYLVRQALLKAENKPVRPKATQENPDPEMPEQGPQVPIDKLPHNVLDAVRTAERSHLQSLTEDYEHSVVSALEDAERKSYNEARKAAMGKDGFVLREFNLSYNKKFYDGFEEYCKTNDSYALDRIVQDKKGVSRERFNQWTRAMALVNKSCIRLSGGVRDILACYLDNIVVQYAKNGIINCIAEEHSNLQLRHAITPSDGFDERVPLDAFVRTLDGYQLAITWLEGCRQTREEQKEIKKKIKRNEIDGDSVVVELPAYPDPEYEENFEGYVVEICRSVRMQLADEQKVAADKAKYHNIKISEHFKKFCSILIYESILRIGAHLKEVVALKDVKTVNEALMYHSLKQVSNICGIDFTPIRADMTTRLAKFGTWCSARRESRRANRKPKTTDPVVVDDEDEDEEEEVAEEAADDADDVVAGDGDEDDAEEEEAEAEDDGEAEGELVDAGDAEYEEEA